MRFLQKGNESVWDGQKIVPFVNGVLETDNPDFIARLEKMGYKGDEDGEAVKGNPEGQAAKKEQTFAELRAEAKGKIQGYGKMTKLELIEALKEGE